jgi:hypothetical protein
MLRRSLDRDNKLEAKRLAQRNNTSFVFGSSTPRTLDLDLPALGCGRSQTMLFATPNRQSDENQSSRRRPVSAYYSDDFNSECLSRYLLFVYLSTQLSLVFIYLIIFCLLINFLSIV